jgi:hypothetical protein
LPCPGARRCRERVVPLQDRRVSRMRCSALRRNRLSPTCSFRQRISSSRLRRQSLEQ